MPMKVEETWSKRRRERGGNLENVATSRKDKTSHEFSRRYVDIM
jgi:hypothetical protein